MIPYIVLLVAYAVVAMRVQCWSDISILGFKLNTPQGYLDSPRRYHIFRAVMFFAAIIAALFAGSPPIGKAVIVLIVVWALCSWIGRNDAFDAFRQTHKDLLAYEDSVLQQDRQEYLEMLDGEDPVKRRAELEDGAGMTNAQLRERLKLLQARGP